jgi:hypothetical protein
MISAGEGNDAYVAQKVNRNFRIGLRGFPCDKTEAAKFEKIATKCEISELSLFHPFPDS